MPLSRHIGNTLRGPPSVAQCFWSSPDSQGQLGSQKKGNAIILSHLKVKVSVSDW